MKVPIVRLPLELALEMAFQLEKLARRLEALPPGADLADQAVKTRELSNRAQEAVMSGVASVTDGRNTRAGDLHLDQVARRKGSAP